jgi:hypothetical protein
MWKVILAEELEHSLHPSVGQDLPVELDKRLSWHVMKVFDVLVDLGMLSIQDIPQLPKIVQEVLHAVDLILKRLQQVPASDAGPWD